MSGRAGRAFRLAAFEADDVCTARHALKVVLTFHLLDALMPLATLADYVSQVGITATSMLQCCSCRRPSCHLLVTGLVRAGVLRCVDGELLAA